MKHFFIFNFDKLFFYFSFLCNNQFSFQFRTNTLNSHRERFQIQLNSAMFWMFAFFLFHISGTLFFVCLYSIHPTKIWCDKNSEIMVKIQFFFLLDYILFYLWIFKRRISNERSHSFITIHILYFFFFPLTAFPLIRIEIATTQKIWKFQKNKIKTRSRF